MAKENAQAVAIPSLSLTEWWTELSEQLNLLEQRFPNIANKPYFVAARDMIKAGLKTETTNIAMLIFNKRALNSAEKRLGLEITKQRADGATETGYLPFIGSPLALQFALVFYEHLIDYNEVIAQGGNGHLLQYGYSGDGTSESIAYHKPFTHNAALQLKQAISDYIVDYQQIIFEYIDYNELEFNTMCELVGLKKADIDEDFFYPAPEAEIFNMTNVNIEALMLKMASYFQYHFSQIRETDPIRLLNSIQTSIFHVKTDIEKIYAIKVLIDKLETLEKEHATLMHALTEDRSLFGSIYALLSDSEKKELINRITHPTPQTNQTSPTQDISSAPHSLSDWIPSIIKHPIAYLFGQQAAQSNANESVQTRASDSHYPWLIQCVSKSLEREADKVARKLTVENVVSFKGTDFTHNSKADLKQLSSSLGTFNESLSEIEHAIDRYIKKHRIGIACFVDFKPIRMMTSLFATIGMGRVINDKYFLFKKARKFERSVSSTKLKLENGYIDYETAKQEIDDESDELLRGSKQVNQKSLYFRFFKSIRNENDEASDDLCQVATKTKEMIAASAA